MLGVCLKSNSTALVTLIVNILLTLVLIMTEINLTQFDESFIVDAIFLVCAIVFSTIYLTNYLAWNSFDLSPMFFWAIAMKKIFISGIHASELYYLIYGFLCGQYAGKQYIIDDKNRYWKFKTVAQQVILIVAISTQMQSLPSIVGETPVITTYLLIILVGLHDCISYYSKKQVITVKDEEKEPTIRVQKTATVWDDIIESNVEDWYCTVEYHGDTINWKTTNLNSSLRIAINQQNNDIQTLLQSIKILNVQQTLQQSVNLAQENENECLLDWIQTHLEENRQRSKSKHSQQNYRQQEQVLEEIQRFKSPSNSRLDLSNGRYQDGQRLNEYVNQQFGDQLQASDQLPDKQQQESKRSLLYCVNKMSESDQQFMSVAVYYCDKDAERGGTIGVIIRNIDDYSVQWFENANLISKVAISTNYVKRQAENVKQLIKMALAEQQDIESQQNQYNQEMQRHVQQFASYSFCYDPIQLLGNQVKSEKQIGIEKAQQQLALPPTVKLTSSSHPIETSEEQQHKLEIIRINKYYLDRCRMGRSEFLSSVYTHSLILENNNYNYHAIISQNLPKLQLSRVNLDQVIQTVINQLKNYKGRDLGDIMKLNVSGSEKTIVTDKLKIKQLFINLLVNSIDSILLIKQQQQNMNHTIQVNVRFKKTNYLIEIFDTGPGIKEQQLDPVKTISEGRLGIFASYKILSMIGVDVNSNFTLSNVSDQPVEGLRVRFVIPFELSSSTQNTNVQFVPIAIKSCHIHDNYHQVQF